jgi:hypothetical protein
VITDRHGDLVVANAAFAPLTRGVAPDLLAPPVNLARLLLHPRGMARQITNLDDWGWHIIDAVRREAERDPSERRAALVAELEELIPYRQRQTGPDHIGFAVPLRLSSDEGELHLLTTLTHFGTATNVTLAELRLEAFLPADDATAEILAGRVSR